MIFSAKNETMILFQRKNIRVRKRRIDIIPLTMPSHHSLAFTQTRKLFLDFFLAYLRESSRKFRVSQKNAVSLQRDSGEQKTG